MFKTRFKSMTVTQQNAYKVHKDKDTGFCKPEPAGKTLYFGSRKSEKYIRIYDKLAEQLLKNSNDKELKNMTHWVRFETEYKGDTAREILLMYMGQDFSENYCAHVRDMIYFVESDGQAASWWDKFCNDVEPVHLYVWRKHVDTGDFNRMRNTVMIGLGPDEFYSQLLGEEYRLTKRHFSIINGYYHDQQLDKRGFTIPGQYAPLMEQLSLES